MRKTENSISKVLHVYFSCYVTGDRHFQALLPWIIVPQESRKKEELMLECIDKWIASANL